MAPVSLSWLFFLFLLPSPGQLSLAGECPAAGPLLLTPAALERPRRGSGRGLWLGEGVTPRTSSCAPAGGVLRCGGCWRCLGPQVLYYRDPYPEVGGG